MTERTKQMAPYQSPASALEIRYRACLPFNMSIDADPQQQAAASPPVLVVRSFLR